MTLIGNLDIDGGGSIKEHVDSEDIITALFHIGEPKNGGNTLYYNGIKKENKGNLVQSIEFQHGRLQIGFFNEIVHGGDSWEGRRGGINLNLKKNVLSFFEKEECQKYYNRYANDGWPTGYIAI